MRSKKHKYIKMSEESLKYGNIKKIKKYQSPESGIMTEIIMFFVFSLLLILSWLGLIKLIKYQYIFTIYRYINHSISTYFPIQLSSYILILMIFFIVLIITTSCLFFIIKLIKNILRKNRTKIFNRNPIFTNIPLILNSILFLLGFTIKKHEENPNCYYIGLTIDAISLFVLLKINFDKKIKNDVFSINYENEFIKLIFEDLLFDVLLALDLYYCYYVIFQIIFILSNYNIELLNFSGIISNISLGIVSFYTNFNLKSIGFSIIYLFIYLGIFIFQLTIRKEERNEYQVGYGETILSFIFSVCFLVEFIYISFIKCQND